MKPIRRLAIALLPVLLAATACATVVVEPSTTFQPQPVTTFARPGPTVPAATAATTTTIVVHDGIVGFGFVADGEPAIATFDSARGELMAILVESDDLAEGAGDLFYDRSTDTVYFSRSATACSSEVVAVDAVTGEMRIVASGSTPAVSPDGRFLAYSLDPVCQTHRDVRIRDLNDGSERVWESELDPSSDLIAIVTHLAWSPDSATLAVEILLEDGIELRLIDATGDGGNLIDMTKVVSPDGATWTAPMYLPDGSLILAEACCGFEPDEFRVVAVEMERFSTRPIVALPAAGRPVDVHPTGEGILVVMSDGPELWVFTNGVLRFLTAEVVDAVWRVGHGAAR